MDPALAIANLTSPPVLFFALGVAAALARSDLAIPEAIAKAMSLNESIFPKKRKTNGCILKITLDNSKSHS